MAGKTVLVMAAAMVLFGGQAMAATIVGSFDGVVTEVSDRVDLFNGLGGIGSTRDYLYYTGPHVTGTFEYVTSGLSSPICDSGYQSYCTFETPNAIRASWHIDSQTFSPNGDLWSELRVMQGGNSIWSEEQGFGFIVVGNCIGGACDRLDLWIDRATRGPNEFARFVESPDSPIVSMDWTAPLPPLGSFYFLGSGQADVHDGYGNESVVYFDLDHLEAHVADVPEPSSLALLSVGMLGLPGLLWRNNRREIAMKSLEEFLSFAETFPTAIAQAMDNGWTTEDVRRVIAEIRVRAAMPSGEPQNHGLGAVDPRS